jgi:hypothetical protein
MASYDASTAQCWVFSYKEGLLSKVAHDLKHRVTAFSLRVDPQSGKIEAELDARSLRIECVMENGQESAIALSEDDKNKIQANLITEVLHADEHHAISFRSTSVTETPAGLQIEGSLELNGKVQPIVTMARRLQTSYVAELTIHQPSFGIKPFSAMFGALRIKPDVLVRVVVPVA